MTCKDQEHKCTLREIKKEKNTPETKSSFEPKRAEKSLQKYVRFHHIESDRRMSKRYWFLQENW